VRLGGAGDFAPFLRPLPMRHKWPTCICVEAPAGNTKITPCQAYKPIYKSLHAGTATIYLE
jgi:hypothetical protein